MAGGDDDRNVWRVNSQTSFPLFTCSFSGSEISVSLKLEGSISQLANEQKVEFWGDGKIGPTNLSETSSSSQKTYKLKIFKSGNSNLEAPTDSSGSLSENFWCDTKNVFKVTGQMSTVSGSSGSEAWSKSFDQIKLTLSDCDKDGRKECSIKIGDQVGLEWANDFKPKVIL